MAKEQQSLQYKDEQFMTKWPSTTNSFMGGVEYVCAGNRIKTTIKPIQGSYQSKTEITSSNILKVELLGRFPGPTPVLQVHGHVG